ncbi:MAG: nucleotidyltransferase family protein [Thermomicrobiales bacterium]
MPRVTPVGRFVAGLADGGAGKGRVDPAGVVKWCVRNKYPLVALAANAPAWLLESATFRDALIAERASYELQRDEYCVVRDAWLARGIACLMIKSAGNAPSFPHTSDNIDILVPPAQGEAARDTLRELGYVELRHIEEPQKYLFRRFRAGQSVSAIHVHEQVGWLVGFMDEGALWSRRMVSGDDAMVTIPSPEDAVLINLAHACYENKIFRFNDIIRIRYALRARGADFDWAYVERVAASRGWRDGLAFMFLVYDHLEPVFFGDAQLPEAQRERFERIAAADRPTQQRLAEIRALADLELPLDLSYKYCKWLYYRKILGDPQMSRFRRWADVATTLRHGVRLKSGIRPQPGMAIAVSGPDGSGKTTHAQVLVETLRFCGIKTDYVWNRGGSTGLLKVVSRLRGRGKAASAAPTHEDGVSRRQRQLRNPAIRFAWSWLVALDQVGTYLWRVHLPARLGRVVVADRYAYDTAAEMDATLPRDDRWSRLAIRAMLRLVPRPQAAFVLAVPQALTEQRRRDEVWGAEPEIERERYRALAEAHGLRVVPNDGTFADCNDTIFRVIMATYMVDFGTPLNGLFGCNPDQKNRPDTVWRCAETRRALIELQVAGLQVSSFSISDVLELDNLEPANLQPATIVEVAR